MKWPSRRSLTLSRHSALIPLLGLLLLTTDAVADDTPRKSIEAYRMAGEALVIDGVLDEAVWQKAPVSGGFVERSPNAGAKPPADGRVRILYDAEAIILGLEMGLMPGEIPVGRTLTRESSRIWSDDAVTVKFDVRYEQRNLVGFGVNVAGATIDFVSLENGQTFRTEFDAVWEAKTSVRSDAWVVEMRIPYRALGLPKRAGLQTLGLNIARDHNTRRATDDWSAIPPGFGPGSAIHCGKVVLKDVGAPTTLSIIPYVTLERPGDNALIETGPLGIGAGTDLRLRLGEDVWGEMTFLTDFAEVDLDAAVLNFSRFPLALPEKRQFFLTGLDVFNFGQASRTQLFRSRRVGLDGGGNELPIIAGGKVYGRVGKLAFGALEVLTAETEDSPATSFSVARAYQEMGRLRLGSMIALRTRLSPVPPAESDDPTEPMDMPEPMDMSAAIPDDGALLDHVAAGVDGNLRLANDRLNISTFGAATFDRTPLPEAPDADARRGYSGAVEARWRGTVFRPNVSLTVIDEGFDPKMGYVRRKDIAQGRGELEWEWRRQTGRLQRVNLETYAYVDRTADFGEGLGHSVGAEIELRGRTGYDVSVTLEEVVDVVTDPFPLFGVTVASGELVRRRAAVEFARASQRNPSGKLLGSIATGPDGDGEMGLELRSNVTFGPHVRFNANVAWNHQTLLEHESRLLVDLDSLSGSAGLVLSGSPDFSTDFVVQGTTARREDGALAPIEDIAGTALVRLRWRYLPGSDLFVVYRHPFNLHDSEAARDPLLTLKLSYWYDVGL